jgi:hypothetical protein
VALRAEVVDLVAVSAGDLLRQTMRSKESEFRANGGGTPPSFFLRSSRGGSTEALADPGCAGR